MKKKKLKKEQVIENQVIEAIKFKKMTMITLGIITLFLGSILVFYTYGHETKFAFRKYMLYGKEVPKNLVCMNGNSIKHHNTEKYPHNNKIFYFCNEKCFLHLVEHFNEVAFITDAFSGDTIYKSDALIGLKEKREPEIVYFKNKQNFLDYYNNK